MQKLRTKLSYANVVATLAMFLALAGGTAVAANQLAKNSVGPKQLKKNAVTPAKIKKNAVTTAKIKNNAVTGAKINEGTLGAVPNATNAANAANATNAVNATNAANLVGQTPFFIRLGFGQQQTIASNGPVSFVAVCSREGGYDYARILFASTLDGSVADGEDYYYGGPGETFGPGTPASDRLLIEAYEEEGQTTVYNDIDEGFVLSPTDKMLTTNSEGIALGLNYGQQGCLFGGVVNALG